MKFGRSLPRNQVPEWASSYINYKKLKNVIKIATGPLQTGEPDLAGTVDCFFLRVGTPLTSI